MTLTIFIALCLLGCGFMLYVLLQWIRDTRPKNATGGCEGQEQDIKQLHVVTFGKTSRNKVNVPTATDDQLLDSERIAYERIARCLTPRKRV